MRVALTFDDGPGPATRELLDVLDAAHVRATFFVLGRNVAEAPWCGDPARAQALVVRALRGGHVVGNHTYSHRRPDQYLTLAEDLRRGDEVIRACRAAAGIAEGMPIPVRLPYGIRLVEKTAETATGTLLAAELDPRLAVLASLGRTHVHWTCDFHDWVMTGVDASRLAQAMISHCDRIGALGLDAVLDLHDSGTGSSSGYERPATLGAVRAFLATAMERRWDFFTVPT